MCEHFVILTQHCASKSLLLLSVLLLGPENTVPVGQGGLVPVPVGSAQVASSLTPTVSGSLTGLLSGVVVVPLIG
jgi:hypothetical protein